MRSKEVEEAIETYKKLHEDIKFTDKDYKEAIEEAKKQIEYHRNLNDICCFMTDSTTLKALLSLIEKQQEETAGIYADYQDLGKEKYMLECELEKKDKIIKQAIEYIENNELLFECDKNTVRGENYQSYIDYILDILKGK